MAATWAPDGMAPRSCELHSCISGFSCEALGSRKRRTAIARVSVKHVGGMLPGSHVEQPVSITQTPKSEVRRFDRLERLLGVFKTKLKLRCHPPGHLCAAHTSGAPSPPLPPAPATRSVSPSATDWLGA